MKTLREALRLKVVEVTMKKLKGYGNYEPTQKYKWHKENDVIVCEVDGLNPSDQFRNYVKMVVEMTEAGWEPYEWTYDKKLNFNLKRKRVN